MTLLRRCLAVALVGGLSLTGPAALSPSDAVASSSATATTGSSASSPVTAAGLPGPVRTADDDPTVGTWRVTPHADGGYTVSWTSPEPLPVTDDRPTFEQDGRAYAVPQLSPDGTTLSVEVPADPEATAPDPDSLDVVLSGRTLDAPQEALPPVASAIIAPLPGTTSLTPDPGTAGPHPVAHDEYSLPGVKMPGMPAKIEMLGHVVWPSDVVAPGSAPLVLFLHGRHDSCYHTPGTTGPRGVDWPCPRNTSPVPSYLGYRYVQNLLASQGYVSVSISANGINAQDWRLVDGGAAARGQLVREHLDAWADPAEATEIGAAAGLADLDRVVLIGHSRGGEGANRASAQTPLSAPYRIVGQVLIGPTDFGRQTAPYVPTVTVLPYCDGDVSDLQGQTFTDLARDYVPDDSALHSSLMVMGANHNFFNTEWTPGLSTAPSFDDWFSPDTTSTCSYGSASRLTKAEQQAVGKSYLAGAVRLMADADDAMLPLFDGSRVSLASAGDTDVRSHAVRLDRVTRAPGHGATLLTGPAYTAATQICTGRTGGGGHPDWCGRGTSSLRTPHWPGSFPIGAPTQSAFEMSWDGVGQVGGLRFGQVLNLTGRTLHLRTIAHPGEPPADLTVRVIDDGGHVANVDVRDVQPLPRGSFVLAKRWAQDVAVDSADITAAAPAMDLTRIREVDLVSDNAGGRVWVLDVAAGAGVVPTPPAKRTGRLTLGSVTTPEGDHLGVTRARLPFHIAGNVARPTRFRIAPAGFFGLGFGHPFDVVVPAGVRNGSVAIPYRANERDDLRRRVFDVAAYGMSGAMPTAYTARLVVLDDDPTPTLSVTAQRSPIREGWVARWTARLSKPVNYHDTAFGTIRPGPRQTPGLRADDVPIAWLRDHAADTFRPHQPLDQIRLFLAADVRPGQRTVTFAIPIRRDRVREGLEHLTITVAFFQAKVRDTTTIQVKDPARP